MLINDYQLIIIGTDNESKRKMQNGDTRDDHMWLYTRENCGET